MRFSRMGMGTDAEFCRAKAAKGRVGIVDALKILHWCNYASRTYSIGLDGKEWMHVTASSLTVAILPEGGVEISLYKPFSLIEAIPLAVRTLAGRKYRDSHVLSFRAENLVLDPHSEVTAHLDGVPARCGKISVGSREGALEIVDGKIHFF